MPVTISFDPNSLNVQSATIQNATPSSDGVMSKAQAATLAAAPSPAQVAALQSSIASLIATAAVDIYVDAFAGSDSNPGTQAAPLQTFDAAVNLLPAQWEQSATIHCAAGNYAFDVNNYIFGSPIGSKSAPLLIKGVTADQLGTLTTLAGSTNTSYVASVVTTSGELRGASVMNARTGKQVRISNNEYNSGTGQTTFTLMSSLSVTVGDEFTVSKPATIFQYPGVPGVLDTYVSFLNIHFEQTVESGFAAPAFVVANNGIADFFNCDYDCGSSGRFMDVATGSRLLGSSQSPAWGNLAVNPVSFTNSGLWVFSSADGGASFQVFDSCQMIGYFMLDGINMNVSGLSVLDLFVVDAKNSSFTIDTGSVCNIDSLSVVGSAIGNTFTVQNGSLLNLPSGGLISTSLGSAVDVKCARANLPGLTGSGNAMFGIVAELGSQVRVSAGTTVTGASGNTKIGTTVTPYTSLPFTDTNVNSIQIG